MLQRFLTLIMSLIIFYIIVNLCYAEVEIIKTGYIIAYGKYIKPPYTIQIRDNILFVNNIPYFPTKKGRIENKKIIVKESTKEKHKFVQKCWKKYFSLLKEYNETEAKEKIINYAKQSPIVETAFFDGDTLIVKFRDNSSIRFMFNAKTRRENSILFKDDQKELILKKQMEDLTNYLKKDMLVAFGKGYRIIVPPQRIPTFMENIQNIMSSDLDAQEKREELLKIIPRNFAEDLLSHWE